MSYDQEDKAAAAIKKATRANAEDHGTRPLEQVRELREQAAKSGHICGDCFQPIEPGASVTIETRSVHVPAEDFGKLGKRPAHDHKLLVPICIACWLLRIQRGGLSLQREFYAKRIRRLHCEGCGRPMRLYRPEYLSPLIPNSKRVCCDDCRCSMLNRYSRERRRVVQSERKCVECRKTLTPTRADQVTCSNRCRQKRFRIMHKASK